MIFFTTSILFQVLRFKWNAVKWRSWPWQPQEKMALSKLSFPQTLKQLHKLLHPVASPRSWAVRANSTSRKRTWYPKSQRSQLPNPIPTPSPPLSCSTHHALWPKMITQNVGPETRGWVHPRPLICRCRRSGDLLRQATTFLSSPS